MARGHQSTIRLTLVPMYTNAQLGTPSGAPRGTQHIRVAVIVKSVMFFIVDLTLNNFKRILLNPLLLRLMISIVDRMELASNSCFICM